MRWKRMVYLLTVCTGITVLYVLLYPIYIRWISSNYAKQFGKILNSHDLKQYDAFFSENTVFRVGKREVLYSEIKDKLAKQELEWSEYSYGSMDDSYRSIDICLAREYEVSLRGSVGSRGFEGDFILVRKGLLFLEIKEVDFDMSEQAAEELLELWKLDM